MKKYKKQNADLVNVESSSASIDSQTKRLLSKAASKITGGAKPIAPKILDPFKPKNNSIQMSV